MNRKRISDRGAWSPAAFWRVLLILGLSLAAAGAGATTQRLDGIAAVVDEDVILRSELAERVERVRKGVDPAQLPPDEVLTQQVLERLIVENLELQTADRAGVRISDEELNETMAGIASQNGMNLEQFQQALAADGIAYSDMREQIRREMRISRVQRGVMNSRIEVSDQEIDDFLASEMGEVVTSDEYNLLHILLGLEEDAGLDKQNEVRARAEAIFAELQAGGDFKKLAISNSTGQNALEGGDLGWRKAAQLPTLFADRVQAMAVGDLLGPIRSGSGFHIIKLVGKRGAKAQGQVDQTRSRHILIKTTEIRSDEEARALAQELRDKLRQGADFAKLAQEHSDDPASALNGGDLGWNQAGAFVPEFEAALATLKVDETSEVFKTEHGYHVAQVTGRRVEDFSDEFKRNQAANYLRNRKFEEELETWLRELRSKAFVEIRL